ncbi:MAG: cation:proton antiporter [Bacillota bacterium]|nr:cation:proton antiporter [Bacillota bacterium]
MTIVNQVLGIAVLFLFGYFGGRVARIFKMPSVTGYVIAGLLVGPSVFNLLPRALGIELESVKVLGLGMIALIIGGELEIPRLKLLGRSIYWITPIQVIITWAVVFAGMFWLAGMALPESLLFAALATATAPATPVAIIREYNAKGRFTSTLMSVVAIDDAACIILFGMVSAAVAVLLHGTAFTVASVWPPIAELGGSLLIGIVTAMLLILYLRNIRDKQQRLVLLLGLILLNSGIAQSLHYSPLLTNMTSGFIIANIYARPSSLFAVLNDIELPIFILFFTLAGLSLHLDILIDNWPMALFYVVLRSIGKVGGVSLGAHLGGASKEVVKYLGFAMLSKAGVTIGLLLLVQSRFPTIAVVITAVELAAVTIFEIIGPGVTRHALFAAGEAGQGTIQPDESE